MRNVGIFAAILIAVIAFGTWKLDQASAKYAELNRTLNNQIALADSLKEVAGGWEKRAFINEGLNDTLGTQNSELAETINKRDEEIVALTKANLKLEDTIFMLTEETGEVADSVIIDTTSGENRFRVDFKSRYGIMNVFGHTLTNPAEANIRISWDRPLELTTILSRTKDGSWHGYLASPDSLFLPTKLETRVDDSLFSPAHRPWYRRFIGGLGTTGTGAFGTLSWESGNNMYGAIYLNRTVGDIPYSGWGFLFQRRF